MDAESLVQIERIVTTAVGGAEERLHKETETLAESLRHELRGSTEALGKSLRHEFGERMEALGASLRHELAETSQALGASLRQELGDKIEEVKRHSGVLYEDLGHRLDLIVEGHQGLQELIRNLDAKIEHEWLETRALIQLSYRQLQDRVENLEQRVLIIEKRLGFSA